MPFLLGFILFLRPRERAIPSKTTVTEILTQAPRFSRRGKKLRHTLVLLIVVVDWKHEISTRSRSKRPLNTGYQKRSGEGVLRDVKRGGGRSLCQLTALPA